MTHVRPRAVLLDLLMATLDSMSAWAAAAARGPQRGLAWRDAVTERMTSAGAYRSYEAFVEQAAAELGLAPEAPDRLWAAWRSMRPWPDAASVERWAVPYGFVTNCSAALAEIAGSRSGLRPAFVLSAEEAGWYKPRAEVYRLACERLGLHEDRVLFVAGAAYDALGARAAGLSAVLVARRPAEGALPADVAVVGSLADIELAG